MDDISPESQNLTIISESLYPGQGHGELSQEHKAWDRNTSCRVINFIYTYGQFRMANPPSSISRWERCEEPYSMEETHETRNNLWNFSQTVMSQTGDPGYGDAVLPSAPPWHLQRFLSQIYTLRVTKKCVLEINNKVTVVESLDSSLKWKTHKSGSCFRDPIWDWRGL